MSKLAVDFFPKMLSALELWDKKKLTSTDLNFFKGAVVFTFSSHFERP